MFGNFIHQIGYDSYCRRLGIPPSPEAESAYRRQTYENLQKANAEEAVRNAEQQARIDARPIKLMPFIKAGRLRENTDRGAIVHAVMSNGEDHGMSGAYPRDAICGDAPKIAWSRAEGHEISCKKCIKLMSATGAAS